MPDIRLANVTVEADIQCRARSLDQHHVEDLAAALAAGAKLPPVVVYKTSDGLLLSEGFHRIEAYRRAGREFVPAEVREGTREDAKLNAMASNQGHGLKRTNEDKRRAASEVLKLKPEWSDRRIAEHIGVSHEFIRQMREALSTVDNAPTHRETSDGRSYPAKRAKVGTDAHGNRIEEVKDDDGKMVILKSRPDSEPVNQPEPEPAEQAAQPDTDDDDPPRDRIHLGVLNDLEREAADNGDYEAALDYRRRADELQSELADADDATVPESDPSDDFCTLVAGMCRELDDLARRVADLKASPYARFVHWQSAQVQVKNARETLWGGRPTYCCPYCRVAGEPQPECRCCGGLNVTTKSSYKAGVAAVGGGDK